jgi:DNA-binding LacI/PurR family transcriptional regulator
MTTRQSLAGVGRRHVEVRGWLEQRVGRQWPPGHRLPTIGQLCRTLHVGYTNVHRAVQEMAEAGMLVSRRGAGTFVADPLPAELESPRHRARLLARGKTVRVLLERDYPDPLILRIADAFTRKLEAVQCRVSRGIYDEEAMDFGAREHTDALLVVNPNPLPDIRFGDQQIMVVANTAVESPVAMPGGYDVVSVEQEQGGLLAGRRLREAGLESACFLGTHPGSRQPGYDQTSQARLRGFERGWGEHLPPQHLLRVISYNIDSAVRSTVKQYLPLSPRPQGVFAASDELAVGFMLGALSHGLEAGRDYHLVGFDGLELGRKIGGGPLTTVAVPAEEMGRRAAELLIDRFANPDQPVRRLLLGCGLFEGLTVRQTEILRE